MKTKYIILIIIFFLFFKNDIFSQVALNPVACFIDPVTRTGEMQVINNADEPREISLSFKFGYLAYDSLGNSIVQYNDSITEKEHTLVPFIRVFPQMIIIPPREQATIRFLVRGIPDNIENTYWTRIIARSQPLVQQIDTAFDPKRVSANIVLSTEMIGLVVLIKGRNNSKIDFDFTKTYTDSTKLFLVFKSTKEGNTPYWGLMKIEVYNSSNDLIEKREEGFAFYLSGYQHIVFKKKKFAPGKYHGKISFSNKREEVPDEFISSYIPPNKSFSFEIQ